MIQLSVLAHLMVAVVTVSPVTDVHFPPPWGADARSPLRADERVYIAPLDGFKVLEPTDTALFAVVVAAIADRPDVAVEVDPRPLQPDPAIVVPDGLDLQPHAEALTERRSEMLRRMGIEEIDVLEPSRCPFLLAAMAQRSRAWRECEHERTKLRAIIGLPRPGGIHLPGTRYDEREVGLDRGWRVVRVIHDHRYGGVEGGVPPSRLIVAYDYVVEPGPDGGWAFVKKEPLFWLE